MIHRRRNMASKVEGTLPKEYQQLEYLQINKQVVSPVELGITGSGDISIETYFLLKEHTGYNSMLFMSRPSDRTSIYASIIDAEGRISFTYYNGDWNYSIKPGLNKLHKINTNKGTFFIDDEIVYNREYIEFSNNVGFTVFGTNNSSSTIELHHHFKVWRGDELISELIPSIRKRDGTVGFYDTVRMMFLAPTNGKYIAGTYAN